MAIKDVFVATKDVFVATKMILVAAPANDRLLLVLKQRQICESASVLISSPLINIFQSVSFSRCAFCVNAMEMKNTCCSLVLLHADTRVKLY